VSFCLQSSVEFGSWEEEEEEEEVVVQILLLQECRVHSVYISPIIFSSSDSLNSCRASLFVKIVSSSTSFPLRTVDKLQIEFFLDREMLCTIVQGFLKKGFSEFIYTSYLRYKTGFNKWQ